MIWGCLAIPERHPHQLAGGRWREVQNRHICKLWSWVDYRRRRWTRSTEMFCILPGLVLRHKKDFFLEYLWSLLGSLMSSLFCFLA
jgi:hypothetical protein